MGKQLGFFADTEELDRPDLNKCPDCLCFFESDTCPLCGKLCPMEMRAGLRKAQKKKRPKRASNYRPVIPWYHSWWFILIMMFVSPFSIAGIVLLITSPYRKGIKILFAVLMVLYAFFSSYGILFLNTISNFWNEPVDRSLSREEYVAACKEITAEELFRTPTQYEESFVSLSLQVKHRVVNADEYYSGEYAVYYVCTDITGEFTVLIRDCMTEQRKFIPGDTIRIYGEGANVEVFFDRDGNEWEGSVVNAAFIDLLG